MSYGNQRPEYDNNGVGFFRRNDKPKSDKSPHIWAYIDLDGRRYKVSGWYLQNPDPTKPVLKIQLQPQVEARAQGYVNQAPQSNPNYAYQGGPAQPPQRFDQRAEQYQDRNYQQPLTTNPNNAQHREYADYDRKPPF